MKDNRKNVNLGCYSVGNYSPGGTVLKRSMWYVFNIVFFKNYLFPFYGFKRILLRVFGAKIAKGVIIKPDVNIKYPWLLSIGEYTWIGEGVWIDNLVKVQIGSNVCISQGALLLTGNHDYKKVSFDLLTGEITIKDGVWLGSKSVVCPGVVCNTNSVLSVGSVANNDLEKYGIYKGNPAIKIRERNIED